MTEHRSSAEQISPPGPALRIIDTLTNVIDWVSKIVSVFCLVALFLALLVNISLRAINGSGITWAYEIHMILLPWMIAGGAVMASVHAAHITITLLPEMLGESARRILAFVIHVIVIVSCVGILWSSQPILQASVFQRLSTMGISQIWGYSSLVYAFSGMGIVAALHALAILAGRRDDTVDATPASAS